MTVHVVQSLGLWLVFGSPFVLLLDSILWYLFSHNMGSFRIFWLRLGQLAVLSFSVAHIISISCGAHVFAVYSLQAMSVWFWAVSFCVWYMYRCWF